MKTYPITLFVLSLIILCMPATRVFANSGQGETRQMVTDAFIEVLDREPTRREIREYASLVEERNLDFHDLERELRYNYQSGGKRNRNTGRRDRGDCDSFQPRRWVESIFEENIGRLPSEREMNEYCDLCLDERLNKRDLERFIRDDYEGVYEPYSSDRDYHYDYRRYTDSREIEIIIEEAYRDILSRAPDTVGMRNYRSLMIDKGWSERRLREHLSKSPEALYERNSRIVICAFEDLLDREPKQNELKDYTDEMYQRKWDEKKLRHKVRQSREYQYTRPHLLINQAYREVLLRDADSSACEGLRKEIVRNGWTLDKVKEHLRKSAEYKNVTIPKMVKLAYREVLGREPDPQGERNYFSNARKGWTFEMIKESLRKSKEYRDKQ
jgi:hypothetical protein